MKRKGEIFMAENNTKHPTKHNALIKTGIVGVVAGLLGGTTNKCCSNDKS